MNAESDLIFGLTAVRTGLLRPDQLAGSLRDWTSPGPGGGSRTLAEVLADSGVLPAEDGATVAAVVDRLIERSGGASACLETLAGGDATTLADPRSVAASELTAILAGTPRPAGTGVGGEPEGGGRFRVLRPHARGGLGAVYVALDGELHREVALKRLLEAHADDRASRRRFLVEAEITGGLEHPGIVPVYGLGAYADGRPYYAMRFIRGESLQEAIAAFHAPEARAAKPGARSLALRGLLRRFTDACHAIDYAHGQGVIHRDIKPANVIVGRHGETLVVDWGLAKAVGRADLDPAADPDADPGRAAFLGSGGSVTTAAGSILGTPAYMSPEQAAGRLDEVGPASDIYSLGATLYCLLTGRSPFQKDSLLDTLRAVQAGDFPPPREVDPAIDRSLEAIALKAMAREPAGRYATVRALVDDLERWAADEPVSARPETRSERLARWTRRHRAATRAGAAALLVVAVAATAAALLIDRARGATARALDAEAGARRLAQSQTGLALDAVRDYYTGVSKDLQLKQPELADLRKDLLKAPLRFYERLAANLSGAARPDHATRARLAEAQLELGRLTTDVGTAAEAAAVYEKALAVEEGLVREFPGSADDAYRLAQILIALAESSVAMNWVEQARALFDRAAADSDARRRAHPGDHRFADILAIILQSRADLRWDNSDMDGAREDYERAVALGEALVRDRPGDADLIDHHGSCLNNLYILYGDDHRFEGRAEPTLLRSIALREQLVKLVPTRPMNRSNLSSCYQNMGGFFQNRGRRAEARVWNDKALALQEALVREQPNVSQFWYRLAVSRSSRGLNELDEGRPEAAEPEIRKAVAIYEKLAERQPDQAQPQNDLARGTIDLADLLGELGRKDEAVEVAGRAVAAAERCVALNPKLHPSQRGLTYAVWMRGRLRGRAGDPAGEVDDDRRAVAILRDLVRDVPGVGEYASLFAGEICSLGLALEAVGRVGEAQDRFREGIAATAKLQAENPGLDFFTSNLASLHTALGRSLGRTDPTGPALGLLDRGVVLAEQAVARDPNQVNARNLLAQSLVGRGDLLARLGRRDAARADADRAAGLVGPGSRREVALGRALVLARCGDPETALGLVHAEEPSISSDQGPPALGVAAVYAQSGPAGADRALAWIARARGSREGREPAWLRAALASRDFDPVRPRPDFRAIEADPAMPADPSGKPGAPLP